MSYKNKASYKENNSIVEVKSKLDAEFHRFSIKRTVSQFSQLHNTLEKLHLLEKIPFVICYIDPSHNDLLPINNDDNFNKALSVSRPLLRIILQRKGESYGEINGYGSYTLRKKNPLISKIIASDPQLQPPRQLLQIGLPEDFRRVSAIIDIDIVPETHRRVKLMKNGTDKPLGFYIRDGTSYRATPQGVEKIAGIFISRLVPGGLAETTGLLAVNDEVLEVNGIEVSGKSLDQVTDMMVANSSNLIITVKPANQLNNISYRGSSGRASQKSTTSMTSSVNSTTQSVDSDEVHEVIQEDDEDEVRELLSNASISSTSHSSFNSKPGATGDTLEPESRNNNTLASNSSFGSGNVKAKDAELTL